MRLELIHPMVVHFPIVLGLGLFAVDGIAALRKWPLSGRGAVANTSAIVAVAAGIFAVIAFVFGDQAYDIALAAANAPKDALEIHQEIGSITAFALAGWAAARAFLWWRNVKLGAAAGYGIAGIEALLVAAVLVAAWYGGELVYHYGVAVEKLANG